MNAFPMLSECAARQNNAHADLLRPKWTPDVCKVCGGLKWPIYTVCSLCEIRGAA